MGHPRCSGCVICRRDTCAWCAKEAKVSAMWAGRAACPTCHERVLVSKGVCEARAARRRIDPGNPDGRGLCSTCAGLEPMQVCRVCGDADKLYETDRCRRCSLRERVEGLRCGADDPSAQNWSRSGTAWPVSGRPRRASNGCCDLTTRPS
jgi:hypothetical protein